MTNNLTAALPFYSIEIVLAFDADTQLPFFHRAPLTAFFRHLLGLNYQVDYHGKLAIETCEDGQTHYHRGDSYRCALTVFESGLPLLTRLLQALKDLPNSVPKHIPKSSPFAKQMRFVSFHDRLRSGASSDVLTPYSEQTLLCELDLWRTIARDEGLLIRTLSPLAIYRKDAHGTPQLCRNPRELTAHTFFKACGDSLQNLARAQDKRCTVTLPDYSAEFIRNHIFAVSDGYRNPKAKHKGGWKKLNGVIGLLQLPANKPLCDEQLSALILGGYCGIGMHTAFGLGRYQLETLDGQRPNIQTPLQPDETFYRDSHSNC